MVYQIVLPMVLRCARALRARELRYTGVPIPALNNIFESFCEDRCTEMTTSGDLKSGDYLFSPPMEFQRTPPSPPRQIDSSPNGNDLGHYMKFYMKYILSKFAIIVLMPEITFVSD